MRAGVGVVALAGLAVLAMGSPAIAGGETWTVHPGGAITATAGTTRLTDTTTHTVAKCFTSTMSGTLRAGSGLPDTSLGSITSAVYRCSVPIPMGTLTPGDLPWRLNLTAYHPGTGVSHGTLSHLRLSLAAPGCTAVIAAAGGAPGQVAVSYTNATSTLKLLAVGGNLRFSQVTGCFGLISNGDPATLTATYTLSPSQTITSP